MICKQKHKTFFAVIAVAALLLSLAACKGKHKHTYAEQFSYDAEKHWRQATCEHPEEKRDFDTHKFDETNGNTCQICGYQLVELQVKTDSENTKYIRTQPIYEMFQLGFAYGANTGDVKWFQAQENNIAGYTISDGKLTVTVSAVVSNIKYTKEITVPLEEAPIDVETFFAQNEGGTYMLNGVVAGFSSVGTHNEVVLTDKQTGKFVSVRKMGEGKLLYGGYSLPGVQIGDEIIIPVTLVKEEQSADNANSGKIYAEYAGGTVYKTAVVSQKNQIKYPAESVVIASQADLETFLSSANRENNHYTIVKLKGKMHFVMDSGYNFWFSDKQAKNKADIQIDKITPCFNDPAVSYTTGIGFSQLVFGEPYRAAIDYKNPLSADVEITAVFLGGSTTFGQFLILDQSWVTK